MRSHPKRREPALPAFPLVSPHLLHDFIRNIPRGLGPRRGWPPLFQRGRKNPTSHQSLLLLGEILNATGHDSCHRFLTVAHKHLFAVAHELDMSAELRLEISDVYHTHGAIVSDLTMLVMFILLDHPT